MESGINMDKCLRAMVRAFFDGFVSAQAENRNVRKNDAKEIKKLTADIYECAAPCFVSVLMPVLISFRFDSYDSAAADMSARHFSSDTSVKILLRYACGSRESYELVTDEYRRQMESLLSGHIQTPDEHIHSFRSTDGATLPAEKAIRAVVRTAMNGYAAGLRSGAAGMNGFRQASILRMMPDNMHCLLFDEPQDIWAGVETEGLEAVYMRATKNVENFETLMKEMNEAYRDLAEEDGLTDKDKND